MLVLRSYLKFALGKFRRINNMDFQENRSVCGWQVMLLSGRLNADAVVVIAGTMSDDMHGAGFESFDYLLCRRVKIYYFCAKLS